MPDVILPALDEAEALPDVLSRLPAGYTPIVVDNGSTDGSGQVAHAFGAIVVLEPRRGFGAACAAGLEASRNEVICFMDCDGSLDPADLPVVARPVERGEADLVLGARVGAGRSWPTHARWANRALALEIRRRFGIRLRDLGPMRAGRRQALIGLGIRDRRSGWPLEMVLRAANAGWRIEEVEVSYRSRVGRSKVTGTVSGTARAIGDMARALR
jgi:glycosyltransferase involved in cell wall biosynthesis